MTGCLCFKQKRRRWFVLSLFYLPKKKKTNRKISKFQTEEAFLVFILADSLISFMQILLSNSHVHMHNISIGMCIFCVVPACWLLLLLLNETTATVLSNCGRSDRTKFDLNLVAIFLTYQQYVNMETNLFILVFISLSIEREINDIYEIWMWTETTGPILPLTNCLQSVSVKKSIIII